MSRPTVLLHWDATGQFHFLAAGADVVCVDERTPQDRVYRTTGEADQADIIDAVASGNFRDIVAAATALRGEDHG